MLDAIFRLFSCKAPGKAGRRFILVIQVREHVFAFCLFGAESYQFHVFFTKISDVHADAGMDVKAAEPHFF